MKKFINVLLMWCVSISLVVLLGLGVIVRVCSLTFVLGLLSVVIQVYHLPPHHPSPVETWWFKQTLFGMKHMRTKHRTSERFIMQFLKEPCIS